MKILVAYDGSRQAGNAVSDLTMAGLPETAEAMVISVAEPWVRHSGAITDPLYGGFSPVLVEDAAIFDEEARKHASACCDRGIVALEKQFPRWEINGATAEGSPSLEILKKSESWMPDLIVMGSHGRSLLGRAFLGSVSQSVLHHAHASVRITHGNPSTHAHAPRLLVGFDGSADAAYVVDVMAARKWPKGTSITLVAVIDYRVIEGIPKTGLSLLGRGRLRIAHTDWIKRKMNAAAKKLAAERLRVEKVTVEGDARRILLKLARESRADCIFAGSRGLSAMERLLIGSVSSGVAAKAKCTVEISRRPDTIRGAKAAKTTSMPSRKRKELNDRFF
jgi:nucleotide-binding universal stress UspA family protein